MTTNTNHPPDDNPHSEPDRFLVGDRAANSLTGRVVSPDSAADDPHKAASSTTPAPFAGADDEPGLIVYKTEPISLDELKHRDGAKLNMVVVLWVLALTSVLALYAVAKSPSPTATAVSLISCLLAFATGFVYGKNKSPKK